jgi:hypothetical protein
VISPSPHPPRYATPRDPTRPTLGPSVAKVARALGRQLMPWQAQVADTALELDTDTGEWAYGVVVVTVPRQAGKTTLTLPVTVHRGLTVPDARTWYTAQRRQDARDVFMDGAKLLRRSPLRTRLKIRESNGSEAYNWPTGAQHGIFAPGEDALHGKTNALVVVDEAWWFDALRGAALEQSIFPTFATVAGQLWIVSTAGTAESEWLRGYVDRGRAGTPRLAYFEWSVPDTGPVDPDTVWAHHPAVGYTLRRQAVEDAYRQMEPAGFARAWGNRWTTTAETVIAGPVWTAGARLVELPTSGVVMAYDIAVDGTDATVCAAWSTPAGVHVEVAAHGPGYSWVPGRLADLTARWSQPAIGHDTRGPAPDVADTAGKAGLPLSPFGGRDYAAACAAFLSGLESGAVTYTPHEALDAAAAAASRRPLGDAWVWARRGAPASISALVAATLAAWTTTHQPTQAPPPTIW